MDSAVSEVEAAGAPKLNPFEDGFVLAGVVPKENPVPVPLVSSFFSFFGGVSLGLVSGVGNEAVDLLPNENPPAPMLPADDAGAGAAVAVGAPKENPPVPILAAVLVAAPLSPPEGVASDLLASPSLGLSHDKQTVSDFGFWDVHTEHFHCVIWSANMLPHPFETGGGAGLLLSFVSAAVEVVPAGDLDDFLGEED